MHSNKKKMEEEEEVIPIVIFMRLYCLKTETTLSMEKKNLHLLSGITHSYLMQFFSI